MPLPTTLAGRSSVISYLIHDEYVTDRAAGAVNGTAAEPGPGTRNVTDTTGADVLITGGALRITGDNTWGHEGIWYTPAFTRIYGRIVKCQFSLVGTGNAQANVTAVASASITSNTPYIITDTTLYARRTAAGNSPEIDFDYHSGIMYHICRSAGRFLLLDTGSDVKFLWDDEWDATANLYGFATVLSTTLTLVIDSMKVVKSPLYHMNAIASDSFNRANGAMGSTDGAGHLEADSGSGKAWALTVGTWAISGNTAVCSALDGGLGIATVDAETTHVVVQAEVTRTAGNAGIICRWTDSNNYLYAHTDGANAVLTEVNGGVSNVRITGAVTYGAGKKLRVTVDGTRAYLHYGELYVGTYTNAGFLQTGNRCGLYTTDTGNSFDDFQCWRRRGYTDLRPF